MSEKILTGIFCVAFIALFGLFQYYSYYQYVGNTEKMAREWTEEFLAPQKIDRLQCDRTDCSVKIGGEIRRLRCNPYLWWRLEETCHEITRNGDRDDD